MSDKILGVYGQLGGVQNKITTKGSGEITFYDNGFYLKVS